LSFSQGTFRKSFNRITISRTKCLATLFFLHFRFGLTTGFPVFQRIAATTHPIFRFSIMVVVRLNLHHSTLLPMVAFNPPHLSAHRNELKMVDRLVCFLNC
jgi:hypothetical protein